MASSKVIKRVDTEQFWSESLGWKKTIKEATKYPSKYPAKQMARTLADMGLQVVIVSESQ